LSADPRIEVVGTAGDGLDALEKIAALEPDVVTLDLVMPYLDGVGVLRELAALKRSPLVVVVTLSDAQSELVIEALQLGAVDLVKKPTALATDRLYELSDELVEKVVGAAGARPLTSPRPARTRSVFDAKSTAVKLVVVGTSTGGPQALTQLLSRLPGDFPVPIAIALHIPAEYTDALARRLNLGSPLEVLEARDGLRFGVGQVLVARGGAHLTVERDGEAVIARVSALPDTVLYYPSVDLLFSSAAKAFGAGVLGVVLTGMGDDGLKGAREIVAAGGRVLTEAEASSVVFGMPRVVKEAGLSAAEAPIDTMSDELIKHL
jgi:two-component system chemotaxis response regulator CheB